MSSSLTGNDGTNLQVQMFVCVLAMVALTLAAIVHDRKQMEVELNYVNENLEKKVWIMNACPVLLSLDCPR